MVPFPRSDTLFIMVIVTINKINAVAIAPIQNESDFRNFFSLLMNVVIVSGIIARWTGIRIKNNISVWLPKNMLRSIGIEQKMPIYNIRMAFIICCESLLSVYGLAQESRIFFFMEFKQGSDAHVYPVSGHNRATMGNSRFRS